MAFQLILLFVSVDFPVCTFESSQYASHIAYAHDCFYVTYVDDRHYYPYQSLYGCRVTNQGAVLDPDGKLFYRGEVGWKHRFRWHGIPRGFSRQLLRFW